MVLRLNNDKSTSFPCKDILLDDLDLLVFTVFMAFFSGDFRWCKHVTAGNAEIPRADSIACDRE